MDRSRFVQLAALAFGLVLVSFVVRGTSRLLVGYEMAVYLSAPFLLVAALLVSVLFVRGLLDLIGLRPMD